VTQGSATSEGAAPLDRFAALAKTMGPSLPPGRGDPQGALGRAARVPEARPNSRSMPRQNRHIGCVQPWPRGRFIAAARSA